MEALLREYLPHAPKMGIHVAPDLPRPKVTAAVADYAPDVRADEVLALYDNTVFGSAKDGVLFLRDRLVFQNNDLDAPRTIRYEDLVDVRVRRILLGGKKVELDVNRGRATVTETLDFSAHGAAAPYVERFLREAMLAAAHAALARPAEAAKTMTDRAAVEAALDQLRTEGRLSDADRQRLLVALRGD
ncbi:MAG TPA: hypothetical protein VD962_07855 [Rubricoccaceae bacterium]|nr:hypothetical protein [Rubricoccaceae bacterium]